MGAVGIPIKYDWDEADMAESMVTGWMTSPGDKTNILDPGLRRIGVGAEVREAVKFGWIRETVYGTQNFSSCR